MDNTQSYVWACHLLNYQDPDLTLHSAQVRDWYSSEDGLDLHVLDADRSALQDAAAAADDALRRQRDQLTKLAAAWQGAGADSARDFVRRHCDGAAKVTADLRAAADALTGLRDALWQIVDKKVAAVVGIDNRRQAQRPVWLGAAQTVITGAGDRAAASELIDQQVKPFVDNDIRGDWLAAVRSAISTLSGSYDAATAGLTSIASVHFDVPAELGPTSVPPKQPAAAPVGDDPAPVTRAATATAPSSPAPSAAPSMPSMPSAPASSPAMAAAPMPAMTPTQMPAAMPSGPGATPMTAPSGLEGVAQRFADGLGTLLPSLSDGALPDELDGDPPELDESADDEDVDEPEEIEAETDDGDDERDCTTTEHKEGEPPADGEPPPVEPGPVEPVPAEPPPAMPPAPGVPEAPAAESGTPCEIAADELPQAGQ